MCHGSNKFKFRFYIITVKTEAMNSVKACHIVLILSTHTQKHTNPGSVLSENNCPNIFVA